MYTSFPHAVTLMKNSGESLMVKPKVNLSTPASEIQAFNIVEKVHVSGLRKQFEESPQGGASVQYTEPSCS